jgi:hypothetical protein
MTLDAADISAVAQQVARTLYPSGRAWFVAKTGNDANDGLSWDTAKLHIAAATASGGDSIFVGPGTFAEAVDFTGIGLRIIGAGYGATIVSFSGSSPVLIVGDGSRLQDLEAINTSNSSEGTSCAGIGSGIVENCRFTATNTGTGSETALAAGPGTLVRGTILNGDVTGAPRLFDSEVSGAATGSICFGCVPETLNSSSGDTSDLTAILAAIQAQTDKIGAGNIIVLDPVINGNVRVVQGDSYTNTGQGRALTFTQLSGGNWPDNLLSAGTWSVKLKANRRSDITTGDASLGPITGTIVDANNVRFELTAADTDGLAIGNASYDFQIQAEKGSDRATLVTGTMSITKDQNTA